MEIEKFAMEARRLAAADEIALAAEMELLKEVLTTAAMLGDKLLIQRNLEKSPQSTADLMELYNEICGTRLRKVTKYKPEYDKDIRACRLRGFTDETFKQLFTEAVQSDFLCGNTGKSFKAEFKWIIQPSHAVDILSGKYRNRSPNGQLCPAPTDADYKEGF